MDSKNRDQMQQPQSSTIVVDDSPRRREVGNHH